MREGSADRSPLRVLSALPFALGNPLHQQAHQYISPLQFDGESQNWAKFLRSWERYVESANADDRATDHHKATIFKRSVPPALARRMDDWMADGNSFDEWMIHLKVEYGDLEQQERKE